MEEMVDYLFREFLELLDVSDRTRLESVLFANPPDRCLCAGGYSSAAPDIVAAFGSSTELGTVGLSMYLLGFAIGKSPRMLSFTFPRILTLFDAGPMLLAPLSEYYGRNPVYIGSWFILVMFQIPLALAHNMPTVIVCRLIQGFGGSAPLTNTGGSISDVWERNESGNAMMVYGLSSTFSPPMALVITGYLVLNEGWRNLFWALMGITGGILIIMTLLLPETRHSTILEKKAKAVRKTLVKEGVSREAADRISDEHSMGSKRSMHTLFAVNLTRPFRFLFTEEITMAAAAYNGFIYGVVYLFNESFPLVFGSEEGHGFNVGQTGLTFLGIAVGALVAASFYPLQERYYLRRVAENNGKGVPEARMSQARFGALLLPISLFWFAWTSYRSIHWIVPIIGSSLFGAGIYIVILGVLNYVVDSYQTYSASALAGVILVRNVVGCIFPLFAVSPSSASESDPRSVSSRQVADKPSQRQMYERLGFQWASTLLAFLSLLFVPIPIWWFYKGRALRLKSPFARYVKSVLRLRC
jgi:multidrug resistance protein